MSVPGTSTLKQAAIEFLECAARGEIDAAYRLVAPGFRHHNPYFASGAEALKAGMRENAASNPNKAFEVQRAIAEGSLVAVHSRVRMAAMTIAVVHIFRFEDGLIAELWDIGQPQPEAMANELGMF